MKVLFLGSSRFSTIVLKELVGKVEIAGVVTNVDKPSGRGQKLTPNEVKVFARSQGFDVFQFDRIRNYLDEIRQVEYDVALVASFGQILPKEFLDHRLTINVHPSLLPKYRGASPIQSAILSGDKTTGVTIMKVVEEVDSGDIILQKEMEVDGYYSEMEEKLGSLGGKMALEVLKQIEDNSIKFVPQDGNKATFTRKFTKEDGRVCLEDTSQETEKKVRALSEEVGCVLKTNAFDLKIFKVKDVKNEFNLAKGQVLDNKKRFVIGLNDGAIEILSCQSPSGKIISGRDFLNGHNDILGKTLC